MKNEVFLNLKDILKIIFLGKENLRFESDLYGTLKESILYLESSTMHSLNAAQTSEIKNYLYDMKRIRNQYAHQARVFTKDREMLNCLKIKDFLAYLKECGLTSQASSKIESLESLLDIEIRAANIQSENSVAQVANALSEYEIQEVAKALYEIDELAFLIEDLKYALDNDSLCDIGGHARGYNFSEKDEIESISKFLHGEKVPLSKNYTEYLISGRDYSGNGEYAIGQFKELLNTLNEKYFQMDESTLELFPKDDIVGNISSGMKEDALKKTLIELREKILVETQIRREHCILRKQGLEKIIRYGVNDIDKLEFYLGDLFYDVPTRMIQEPYYKDIYIAVTKYIGIKL
jgi:hypothetical protein